jgi:TolB-like protein
MPSLLERLKRRKLVQWALAYLAGAWVAFEVVGQLTQTFAWNQSVERIVFVLIAAGFLAALVLAWYHGERGHQRASGVELLMLAGILFIAGIGVVAVQRLDPGTAGVAAESTGGAPSPLDAATASIAVLPFENFGSDSDRHFSDGISEEILNVLAQIPGLRVAARTSSFAYGEGGHDISAVARDLSVGHVLEGSVRRAGNRVRITAQLIGGEDGFHLWSETYDRELTPENVFDIQDQISREVALQLQLRVSESTGRAGQFQTEDSQAHDLFLLARSAFYEGTEESLFRAKDLYGRAVARDSTYAMAWGGLAEVYGVLADAYLPPDEAYPPGLAAAQRAVELAPDFSDAWAIRGAIRSSFTWEMEEALQDAERSLELNPSSTWGYLTVAIYGMWEGGEAGVAKCRMLDESRRVDPLNPFWPTMQTMCFSLAGYHREAIESSKAAETLDPDFVYLDRFVGLSYAALGMDEEAVRQFETAERLLQQPSYCHIVYLADQGRTEEARERLDQLLQLRQDGAYLVPWFLAYAYHALGETDRTLEVLEEGLSVRDAGSLMTGLNPRMRDVYESEEYRALAARYGFPLSGR